MGAACAPVSDNEDSDTDEEEQKLLPNGQPMDNDRVYLFVEYPISVEFDKFPWDKANKSEQEYPGFISKTWLSGHENKTVGGFYEFNSHENAQHFIDEHIMAVSRQLGVESQNQVTCKIYNKDSTKDASQAMNSPYFKRRKFTN